MPPNPLFTVWAPLPRRAQGLHFHSCSDGGCSQDLPFCAGLSCCLPQAACIMGAWEGLELSGGTRICSADILSNEQPMLGVHFTKPGSRAGLDSPQGSTRGHYQGSFLLSASYGSGSVSRTLHTGQHPGLSSRPEASVAGKQRHVVGCELCPVRPVPCRSSFSRGGDKPQGLC